MTASSLIAEDVAPDAEDVITAAVSRHFPPVLLDDLWARQPRLSAEDLAQRIRSMTGQSFSQIRAGLEQIATELELYRCGFDAGYEAGQAAR